MLSNVKKPIEYQCNLCNKSRLIYVSEDLHIIDETGTKEYVDVHLCKNNTNKAVILNVDPSFVVRSQFAIDPIKEDSDTLKENYFNIPIPNKSDLTKKNILFNDYTAKNLKELSIIDKLRQTILVLDSNLSSKEESQRTKIIGIASNLQFIHIEARITNDINTKNALEWLKNLADILESMIVFNEDLFYVLGGYIDGHLMEAPSLHENLVMKLLLQASLVIPYTTEDYIKDFEKEVESLLLEVSNKRQEKLMRAIIQETKNNSNQSILFLYYIICANLLEELEMSYNLLEFIEAFIPFIIEGLISLDQIEFITIN